MLVADSEEIKSPPTSGTTVSVWIATARTPVKTVLNRDTSANVCIIGAGIAGLTTAYLLAREGKSVVVLNDGPIGGGLTPRTTAHLTNARVTGSMSWNGFLARKDLDSLPQATQRQSIKLKRLCGKKKLIVNSSDWTGICFFRQMEG